MTSKYRIADRNRNNDSICVSKELRNGSCWPASLCDGRYLADDWVLSRHIRRKWIIPYILWQLTTLKYPFHLCAKKKSKLCFALSSHLRSNKIATTPPLKLFYIPATYRMKKYPKFFTFTNWIPKNSEFCLQKLQEWVSKRHL